MKLEWFSRQSGPESVSTHRLFPHTPPTADGSFLHQFLAATEGMGAAERGAYLEHPPQGAPDIDSIHQARPAKRLRWPCLARSQ